MNVGLGDETMTSSLKFSTEREKEDEEACKLWKNIRAMKHSVEAAINGSSHAMLCFAVLKTKNKSKKIEKVGEMQVG